MLEIASRSTGRRDTVDKRVAYDALHQERSALAQERQARVQAEARVGELEDRLQQLRDE